MRSTWIAEETVAFDLALDPVQEAPHRRHAIQSCGHNPCQLNTREFAAHDINHELEVAHGVLILRPGWSLGLSEKMMRTVRIAVATGVV